MAKKILLIEDDEFLSEVLIKRLDEDGYEVTLSKTAVDGLVILKDLKPDLILLDLILPEMSGFEFLKKIKANPNFSAVPVVILSNLSQEKEKNEAKALGAIDYLIKATYTTKEILDRIKEIIGNSNQ